MELSVACIYCGINRFVAISDTCYTDLMADQLVIPHSPEDIRRQHYWVEVKLVDNWYGDK